jgi:hypothetical protein
MSRRSISLVALAVALAARPALAEDAVTEAAAATEAVAVSEPGSAADAHAEQHGEKLVVTGVRRSEGDVLGGVSVLGKAELTREVRTSIGGDTGAPAWRQRNQLRGRQPLRPFCAACRATESGC